MPTFDNARLSGYRYTAGVGQYILAGYSLSAYGTVDAELVTRLQTNISPSTGKDTHLFGRATVVYTEAELIAAAEAGFTGPVWQAPVSMFLVHESAFAPGVTPTPAQIRSGGSLGIAGVSVFRGQLVSSSTAGTNRIATYSMTGPNASDFSTGAKYWMMFMPVLAKVGTTPSVVNDRPFYGTPINEMSQGISFWTNRRPLAPVITSPVTGAVYNPGEDIPLAINTNDPDEVSSDKNPDASGINGVQIQYAAKPTLDNPNPPWQDLTLYSTNYTPNQQPSWTIYGSTVDYRMAGSLIFGNLLIRAGGTPVLGAAVRGHLPQGDWQLRVRTFDPGNPWNFLSTGIRPINGIAAAYTPDNYYTSVTSPWSNPVTITIPAQIPAPQPISPVNRVAISEGDAVTLVWKYRNTANPVSPQAERVVQLRRNGETEWTTLTSGAGSAAEFEIPDDLSIGLYQWRVQTTDATDETSDFSQIAEFWIVPAPQSGGGRPNPDESVDGATLGCGTHRVEVFRRGGKTRVGELTGVSYLDYNRVRDDISTSKIVVQDWGVDCGDLLKKLQTWAYEIVIYRDNGYSVDRVWEGPITLLTYEVDAVTIQAKDVMAYPYRRIIKQAMNDTALGATVTDRAMRVIQNVMAPDDPNVLPYLNPIFNTGDTKQYRSTPAYSRTAFEEIDDMAANAGLDYTAVGRSILLWSTKQRIGTLPEFRDDDFGSPPIVSEYGMSMANFYSVSDGNGIHGEASRLGEDDVDEIYGRVEMLSSTWATDTQAEVGTYTQEGLQTVIESFSDSAERSINDRYPPPVIVRVPDNTTLNPDAVISIQQLVPGVVIPLRSQGTLRTVIGNQKLDSVKVVEVANSETITVTMSPFSQDDGAVAEGEEA